MPRRQAPVQPALLEWNFSDCPADEFSLARFYEYTRSSSLIRQTATRKRQGEQDSLTGALFLVVPFNLYWIFGGPRPHWWPDTPYLAIPREERRSILILSRSGRREDLAGSCDPGTNLHDIERLVTVYIPPGWSLSKVKKGFGELVLRDYPHLLQKPVQRFWRKKPGAGSYIEQCRSDLNMLSAWRLQEHGYTAPQALELARFHRVQLYASERSYRNAVRKAKTRIARLEKQLRQHAEKREPR